MYGLYDFACPIDFARGACAGVGDAVQLLLAVVWIAAVATFFAFAWEDRVLRGR